MKSNSTTSSDAWIVVLMFGIWAICIVGWVFNIVKFVSHFAEPLTALEVLRGFGIVAAPMGVVLGWFF